MYNKKWESLAWVIIWVFILTFVLLWIWTLIWNSQKLIQKYEIKSKLNFLTNSSYQIINKLDISLIPDQEVFYIYKNISLNAFEIKIWEPFSEYKYINEFWEKVSNPEEYNWILFLRFFYLKKITENWKEKIAIKWIIREVKK